MRRRRVHVFPRRLWGCVAAILLSACAPAAGPAAGPSQETCDLLITGRVVLTMDQQSRVHRPGYVAIRQNRIVGVGPLDEADRYWPARRMDQPRKLIMPGLINGHQHAAMSLLRGMADDLELMEWLQKYIFPAEAATVDADFVYWGTRLAVVEMLQSGTTTFADMYHFLDEVARASSELGIRVVAGQTVIGFPAPDHPTPEETLRFSSGFIERWKEHPLVIPAVAPHAPYTCTRETLVASLRLAEEHDVPVLIHLAETADEVRQIQERYGTTPVRFLSQIGFLTDRVVAAHGVWLEPEEMQLLAQAGVGVVHNPESNMKLASGVAPVVEMWKAGVDLGLGTDGAASNNNLDMFEAMDFMAKLHKLVKGDPTAVSARQVLHAATMGSARALDLDDRLGSLETGKRADLLVLDLDGASALPLYDPYSLVVYSLKGPAVDTVIIDGKVVLRQGVVTKVDRQELRGRVEQYRRQVEESIGRR